jgi:DNA-binding transcriptional LysR family regulator
VRRNTSAAGKKSGAQKPGQNKAGQNKPGQNKAAQNKNQKKNAAPVVFDAPAPESDEPRTFRLGVVPGATPGRWIDAWKQRMPRVPLEIIPISVADQSSALDDVDAALVRLPLEDSALHVIPLYDEVPVVVAAIDSHLLAVDELAIDDLAGEVVLPHTHRALPAFDLPGTVAATIAPLSTGDAVQTAASGVGIVIVPMSLARAHHRKDADYRPLTDGPTSTVALVWHRERTTPDIETFVGIVRGRTTNSSR